MLGHLVVEDDDLVRPRRRARPRSSIVERRRRRCRPRSQTHDPPLQVGRDDVPVGGVVIDDEHAQAPAEPTRARRLGARRSCRPSGTVKRNVLPWPRRDSAAELAAHHLDEPRARSPARGRCRRSAAWSSVSACVKGSNSRASSSASMPMPVSLTSTRRHRAARRSRARRSTRTTTSPRSVNLTALPTRFVSTWRRRRGRRARRRARRRRSQAVSSSPWRAPAGRAARRCPRRARARSKSCSSSSSLPASIFEKSRMSLMTPSSASPERAGGLDVARAASPSSVGVAQQLEHADDAVHRRADLVAHVGQELRLDPRGARPPRRTPAGARRCRWRPTRSRRSPRGRRAAGS